MDSSENEDILNNLRIFLENKDLKIKNLKLLVNELCENVGGEDFLPHTNSLVDVFSETKLGRQFFLCCDEQCQCNCHKLLKSDSCTQTFESDFHNADFTDSALDWTPDEGATITVADLIKEVVDTQPSENDYVYDETSKMYYSPSTGYYYDSVRNLLYEPYSRTYYKYDDKNNSYEFYYQMDHGIDEFSRDSADQVSQKVSGLKLNDASPTRNEELTYETHVDPKPKPKFKKKKSKHEKKKPIYDEDTLGRKSKICASDSCSSLEDGEVQSTSSSDDSSFDDIEETFVPRLNEDSLEAWPPCIRAIIKESNSEKIGSLFLIPFTGGTIGRQRNSGTCIPDISISRSHAKISFDKETWTYNISDLGSQNGTFINDIRLEVSTKGERRSHPLRHGDMLSLGSCKLLIHIHNGNSTCNECEPGLVQAELAPYPEKIANAETKKDKEKERRHNLKQIKKKFGLEAEEYVEGEKAFSFDMKNYQDRAEVRRKVVGSQNPYEKDAPAASLDISVSPSNKGYQMLKKMGWQDGESIGANEAGILNPIAISYRNSRAGLGTDPIEHVSIPEDPRRRKWKKAQKRFHQLYTEIDEDVDY